MDPTGENFAATFEAATDAAALRILEGMARRYEMDAEALVESIRNYRRAHRHAYPAVLLRVEASVCSLRLRTPELAAWLRIAAEACERKVEAGMAG